MDREEVRRGLVNPQRARFLLGNREMIEWYPGSLTDAGLSDRDIARIGLRDRPLGTSVQEQIAQIGV